MRRVTSWWRRTVTSGSSGTSRTRRRWSSIGWPARGWEHWRRCTRLRATTWAGTSAGSPAPESSTTSTCTSSRAGRATRISCRCSPMSRFCRSICSTRAESSRTPGRARDQLEHFPYKWLTTSEQAPNPRARTWARQALRKEHPREETLDSPRGRRHSFRRARRDKPGAGQEEEQGSRGSRNRPVRRLRLDHAEAEERKLADIEVCYRASVKGKKGQPAKLIRAYEAPAANTVDHGLVDSVGSDSITIKEKDGDSVTIAVNSETKIRVNGKPGALGDIEAGYRAIVHRTSADGPAKALKAYERHGAKSYFRGVVESVGSDSLTVKLRNGSSVTVAVTAATQVRLAGQGLVALSDLKAGYRVNVLRASADGPALVIIARAPKA